MLNREVHSQLAVCRCPYALAIQRLEVARAHADHHQVVGITRLWLLPLLYQLHSGVCIQSLDGVLQQAPLRQHQVEKPLPVRCAGIQHVHHPG
eukprot:363989-Chlamydomonas_euryale.AAC.4